MMVAVMEMRQHVIDLKRWYEPPSAPVNKFSGCSNRFSDAPYSDSA
jgi:hypothetical protein